MSDQGWIQTSATSFRKLVKFFQTCKFMCFFQVIFRSLIKFSVILTIFLYDNSAKSYQPFLFIYGIFHRKRDPSP